MPGLSFDVAVYRARGRKADETFDGEPTISKSEAEVMVAALDAKSIANARALMDTPKNFADRAALETLRSGVFKLAAKLPANDWKAHGVAVQKAFSGLHGKVSVIYPAGNGGRPVVVFVPRDLDPSQPVRLSTYFHGRGGDLRYEYSDLIRRVGEVAPRSNTVFVFPQGWLQAPYAAWMAPAAGESFKGLEAAAIAEAGVTISGRTVTAHSNGGFAVANAANSGELVADRLHLFDCFYETDGVRNWEVIGDWAKDNTPKEVKILYATNEKARVDAFKERVPSTVVQLPGLGHSEIPRRLFTP